MTDPLLQCTDVAFGYTPTSPIFRDVSFAIPRGAMVGLLGPNGAGKTSLLRLLSGARQPQSGKIAFAGRDLATLSRREAAQAIAVVPQEVTMPFAYTVRQMIEMGRTPHLRPLGWGVLGPDDRDAVAKAIATTGTAEFADRVFNELSGGERQRVVVAMALAQSPQLLLLDEPTAHLDVRHQIEALELVARLNRERGLTVLASLHDLNLAARYFPRLILFQRGIVADGPPSAVLAPDLLERVYQVRVQVGILRGARYLSILPPGEDAGTTDDAPQAQAHVVAGGGTGDLVMRALVEAAIPFTAGALNVGDSDYDLAAQLALTTIAEPPFAGVSATGQAATLAAMRAARQVILCPIPIGPGNVALLHTAGAALAQGTAIWLFEPTLSAIADHDRFAAHIAERDYAGGAGKLAYQDLLAAGARITTSLPELLEGMHAHSP